MTGPVLGTRSLGDSVWGSAGAVLLSWEAVDFGQRKAGVDVARAQTSLAKNQTALTELDVASAAADAFLTVLAAEESVRAARANVERLQVFFNNVRTLVQNQLRPGADQSRAQAELAVANNQLSQAVQIAELGWPGRFRLCHVAPASRERIRVPMRPGVESPRVRNTVV